MKILFMTNVPSPYRVAFFSELGKMCDLTVIYERESAKGRNKDWKGVEKNTYRQLYLKGKYIGEDNSFCPGVISYLNKDKYDFIIIGMYSTYTAMLAILYLRRRKIPFILSTDGGFISEESVYKRNLKKYLISSAAYWLSTGKMSNQYLEYYGADRDRIFVYPFTSLEQNDLSKAQQKSCMDKYALRKKLGISESRVLLSVGRFSYEGGYGKGYDTLLRTGEILPKDIGIYIVGDNPTEEFINWKSKLGLTNVHFVGFKNKDELAEYYAAADIFVLLTRKDVWGLVINEAMSFGLPIITTTQCIAGVELIENGKNGYLVDVGDYRMTADKICEMFENPTKILEFGKESRNKIQKYTIEEMALCHYRILDAIQSSSQNLLKLEQAKLK